MEFLEENVSDFDDFNDFLEHEHDSDSLINTPADANYYIGRVKKNRYMIQLFEDQAKNILKNYKEKVEIWRDKKIEAIENDNARCLLMLKQYFDATAKSTDSKLRFPEGNIGFYKTRQSISIDEQQVLDYFNRLKDEDALFDVNKYIENKPKVNTKQLRNDGVANGEVFSLNGKVVPGVEVRPASEEFNVK